MLRTAFFSEYSCLVLPTVQRYSVEMLFHRKATVVDIVSPHPL